MTPARGAQPAAARRPGGWRGLVCVGALLAACAAAACWRAAPADPAALAAFVVPVAPNANAAPYFRIEEVRVPASLHRPYNHTSSLIALASGELLLAWGAGARELATDTAILLARRGLDGAWAESAVVADTPGRADANCVLVAEETGRLRLFWAAMFGATFCESRVMVRESDDAGRGWTAAQPALPALCVLLRNKPIRLRSGRWVLPAYWQGVYASQFWISDDDMRTWQPGDLLLTWPNNLQPALIERSDGSLFALMRQSGPDGRAWSGVSRDGGVSWRLERSDAILNPDSGLDLLRLRSGVIVAAYNDSGVNRWPLVARASLDEGATWLPPRLVAPGPGQQSYPSLAEGPDGMIHLSFSARLEAIACAEFNLAWLHSDGDGG